MRKIEIADQLLLRARTPASRGNVPGHLAGLLSMSGLISPDLALMSSGKRASPSETLELEKKFGDSYAGEATGFEFDMPGHSLPVQCSLRLVRV